MPAVCDEPKAPTRAVKRRWMHAAGFDTVDALHAELDDCRARAVDAYLEAARFRENLAARGPVARVQSKRLNVAYLAAEARYTAARDRYVEVLDAAWLAAGLAHKVGPSPACLIPTSALALDAHLRNLNDGRLPV